MTSLLSNFLSGHALRGAVPRARYLVVRVRGLLSNARCDEIFCKVRGGLVGVRRRIAHLFP
jgi:hypothetical protein